MALRCSAFRRVDFLSISCTSNIIGRRFPPLNWTRNFYTCPANFFKQENEEHTLDHSTTPAAKTIVKRAKIRRKRWSQAERTQLREMRERDHSYIEISEALDRTLRAVIHEARQLGLTVNTPRTVGLKGPYSSAELTTLAQMLEKGHTHAEIGEAIGRSEGAITRQKNKLGLANTRREFTDEEDAQIRAFTADNTRISWKTLRTLMPHRSLGALRYRYARLNDAPENKLKKKKSVRWESASQRQAEAEELVKLRNQGLGWIKIAKRMSGGAKNPDYYQRRYNLLVPKESRPVVRDSRWWTEEDIQRLIQLSAAGLLNREIAAAMGKSLLSIQSRKWRLATGILPAHNPTRRRWLKQEVERLLELDASGTYSLPAIASLLDRTVESVAHKLESLSPRRNPWPDRRGCCTRGKSSEPRQIL